MNKKHTNGTLILIGNIINLPFAIVPALTWVLTGILLSITIIGLPFGLQCFKIASFVIWPFGTKIVYKNKGTLSIFLDVLWLLFFGPMLALEHLIIGIILCCTIILIPWGLQSFKFAKLALLPFASEIK